MSLRLTSLSTLAAASFLLHGACIPANIADGGTGGSTSAASTSAASTSAASTSAASGGGICSPGEAVACYTGPAGTVGMGICASGTQVCNTQGTGHGPCSGQVMPAVEVCSNGQDEDCNGQSDEAGCSSLQVVQVLASDDHTCVRLNDNRLKCWGGNDTGQLGLGDTLEHGQLPNTMGSNLPAVNLGTGKTAVAISGGLLHTCALLNDGSVKCWGHSFSGQLGLGDLSTRGDEPNEMGDNLPAVDLGTGKTAVAISSGGSSHKCALLNNGSVKCWGDNFSGALGLGDTANRGDEPNEMGDNLPAVDLGTGKTAVAISGGKAYTCALLNDGSVKCWGYNGSGELGLGDTANRGDGPNEMGDNLPAVDLGTGKTAVAISAGLSHGCALLNDGSVKCWGYNVFGLLGLGDTANRGDGPNEMGDNLPAVNLGTGKTAVAISCGGGPCCALLNDGNVKCWGQNNYGELGQGDIFDRGDGPNEMGDNLLAVNLGTGKTAVAISGGSFYTCALLAGGSVKCWGRNYVGTLGLGDTFDRGDEPNEMGDNLPAVDL